MTVSYKKLFLLLIEKNLSVPELRKCTGLSSCTFTKLRRNEPVTITVLLKIAEVLNCNIEHLCQFGKDDICVNNI